MWTGPRQFEEFRAAGLKDKLEFMFFSRTIRKDDQDSPLAAHSQPLATNMYMYNVHVLLANNVLLCWTGMLAIDVLWIVLISLSNTGFSLKAGNQLKNQLL